MSALDSMDIVYPVIAGLYVGYILAKITYFIFMRRALLALSRRMNICVKLIVIGDAVLAALNFTVLILLGLTTGTEPLLDINQYRAAVVAARGLMALPLLAVIVAHIIISYEFLRVSEVSEEAKAEVREKSAEPIAFLMTGK